jgi:Fuc2NAc and GlcNAc transferase
LISLAVTLVLSALLLAVTLVLSALLCGLYLLLARRLQLLDRPNERSSHHLPTPHGGGVPLLLAFVAGLLLSAPWSSAYQLLAELALVLMVVGVLDDIWNLSVRLRMAVYVLCCVLLACLLFPAQHPLWWAIAALAVLWMLNLYNFMDGILRPFLPAAGRCAGGLPVLELAPGATVHG